MSKVKLYWWDGRKPLTIAYDDTTTVAVVLSKLKSLHKPSANTKLALIDLNVDHEHKLAGKTLIATAIGRWAHPERHKLLIKEVEKPAKKMVSRRIAPVNANKSRAPAKKTIKSPYSEKVSGKVKSDRKAKIHIEGGTTKEIPIMPVTKFSDLNIKLRKSESMPGASIAEQKGSRFTDIAPSEAVQPYVKRGAKLVFRGGDGGAESSSAAPSTSRPKSSAAKSSKKSPAAKPASAKKAPAPKPAPVKKEKKKAPPPKKIVADSDSDEAESSRRSRSSSKKSSDHKGKKKALVVPDAVKGTSTAKKGGSARVASVAASSLASKFEDMAAKEAADRENAKVKKRPVSTRGRAVQDKIAAAKRQSALNMQAGQFDSDEDEDLVNAIGHQVRGERRRPAKKVKKNVGLKAKVAAYFNAKKVKITDPAILADVSGQVWRSNAVREGYLYKEGGGHKTWKERWFVFHGDRMYYFDDPSDEEPIGVIGLNSARLDPEGDGNDASGMAHTFALVTPERTWYLATDDKTAYNGWIAALERKLLKGAGISNSIKAMGVGVLPPPTAGAFNLKKTGKKASPPRAEVPKVDRVAPAKKAAPTPAAAPAAAPVADVEFDSDDEIFEEEEGWDDGDSSDYDDEGEEEESDDDEEE